MEKEKIKVKGEDLVKKIKEIIHKGNVHRIIIKNDEGKTYLEIPVNVGIVGALLVPVWAAIGALAALASHFTIEIQNIEKEKEEVEEDTDDITPE